MELDARDLLLKEMFYRSTILNQILHDIPQGVPMIQKILSTACVSQEERIRLADCVRNCFAIMNDIDENHVAYKRLYEELAGIPVGSVADPYLVSRTTTSAINEITPSPARSVGGKSMEPEMKAYASIFYPELPTPGQSPLKKGTTDHPAASNLGHNNAAGGSSQ